MKLSSNKIVKYGSEIKTEPSRQFKTTGYKRILLVACSLLFIFLLSACQEKQGVFIKKLENGHYVLIVNSRPYIVKGVCYSPIPIGANHEYDWWSDKNKPWIKDGELMKKMGINTIRLYQAGEEPEKVKQVISDLYNLYGIRTLLGDWLGFWEYPCPFYGDDKFRAKVKEQTLEMVKTYKDEPGILAWILGNENNYSCLGQINPWTSPEVDLETDPQKKKKLREKIYYSLVNEVSQEIHKVDPNHPVGLGNGELIGLDSANKYCQDVDFVACIIYRGKTFGNLFKSLKMTFDKPLILGEFGADAYDAYLKKEDQNMQAFFLQLQWNQIYENLAGRKNGEGNCLGGTIFEWTDEWWKHLPDDPQGWKVHDTGAGWSNGSYYFDIRAERNMNMNEEWFGIVALDPELENGLNKRIPRKAYYVIREFWKKPVIKKARGNKI